MMDLENIRLTAELLEESFNKIKTKSDTVINVYNQLIPLLEKAKNKHISQPLSKENFPGSYQFTQREFSEFYDFENKYVDFKYAITDGLSDDEQDLIDLIDTL